MRLSHEDKSTHKLGFFTKRQLEVLYLRSKGLSLREIAKIMGASHQNIAMIEKRALENISRAKTTLLIYELATSPVKVILREGTRHVDIPALIIDQADKAGVMIRGDIGLMLKTIWRYARDCIESRVVKKPILVLVNKAGELKVYPLDEIRDVIEELEKIGLRLQGIHK